MKARWYVYELADPRDGLAFYVGKGTGNRVEAHEREAEAGVCSEKTNKIKEIWAADCSVLRRIVAYFWNEADAYAFEAERVDEYGLENLTNVVPGGGCVRQHSKKARVAEPGEWSAEVVFATLKRGPNLLPWFAWWLRSRETGESVTLTGNKWCIEIVRIGFHTMFPKMWNKMMESPEVTAKLAAALRPHGVELRYGSA